MGTPGQVKRLYNLKEAAHYFGRSVWSVRHLIWSGAIPCVKCAGRVHLDIQDMEAFVEKWKVQEGQ